MADSQPIRKEDAGEDANETLLREIRDDYTYFRDFWRDNHNEMKTDLRFISGDPWEPDDRRNREDNNRPVLCPDELSQYQNATINNLRQNKRSIKVNPKGSGATDKDAERRSAIIKGIEYKSNAQGAYTNAFENQINCGMGFFRVTTKVISKDNEVEPRIKGIENPLSVLLDPNAKEPDFSDQKRCFVMDIMRKRDFERNYPKAQKKSFIADDMSTAPDWFQGENILIAEYWRIDDYDENGEGGKVTQYITNGIEILETNKWAGSWIPIIAAMGKKVYVPVGSEMKKFYYSQIRLARGPQMMLAYGASQEAEVVGMMPRVPLIGYVGQFETDKESFDDLNSVPRNYVQADVVVDGATGQILPLPQRMQNGPDIAGYEAFNERWRRAIQAAMGITPLPTAAQRQNEKSGVALEKIQSQQAVGSFHFTDNFDRAIENAGRQLDELITKVMDTARQVTGRKADETHDVMHIVPKGQAMPKPEPGQPPLTPEDVLDPQKGDFDVTISSGMSYQSQREEASAFVDTLIGEMGNLPLSPQTKATLLARAISLKDIGPIGDDIAAIIDPQSGNSNLPPQAQQQISQMTAEIQQLQAHLAAAVQDLKNKTTQTSMELESKERIEFAKLAQYRDLEVPLDYEKLRVQLTVAELAAKNVAAMKQGETEKEFVLQLGKQAHEFGMQKDQQEAQAEQMQQQQEAQQNGSDQVQPNTQNQQAQPVQPSQGATG